MEVRSVIHFLLAKGLFLGKNSLESCHHVQKKCHAIPGSQLLVLAVQNWSHKHHRFSVVRKTITIPLWPQVTTNEKVLLAVHSNWLRSCKQQEHGMQFFHDGINEQMCQQD
jgi:hypothetical protein